MRPDIGELIERLETATGPDRELDAAIDVLLFGGETVWLTANYTMEQYPASRRPSKQHVGGFAKEHVPLVTASLDAVIALVEQKLPGKWPTILRAALSALASRHSWHTEPVKPGQSSELPIAALIALLRSIQGEKT